jgi:spermidine synthase
MQAKNAIRLMLFGLGFLAIGTQIYLMREFLIVFSGNELIFGIVLALWMLFTGAGAYLGRLSHYLRVKLGFAVVLLFLTGLFPTLLLISLDLMKVLMVPAGSTASLWMIITAAAAVQLPFCILNGFLFSFLSAWSSGNPLAEAYSWESLGSMASGALVNFVFLWIFDQYQSLLLLTTVYFILLLIFTWLMAPRSWFYLALVPSLSLIGLLLLVDFKAFSEKILFRDQHVISNMGTPYGQVVVTRNQEQYNFYENGLLLFSSGNEMANEANVHLAMAQRERPGRVLLISGGYAGTLDEILKYKPVVVDYLEMNPSLIGIGSKYTKQLDHPSIRVHEMDARKYIRLSRQLYDVVLVNLPPPSTLQLNRYYTLDFLSEIKKVLKPGGVISYSLPTGSDYISNEAGRLNALLFHTLKQRFNQALVIPLERNHFLASDSSLNMDIPALILKKGIKTVYVNQFYLDVGQLRERSDYLTSHITHMLSGHTILSGFTNRDFYPLATFYQNLWWLSYFSVHPVAIITVFIIILLLLLASLNSVSAGLFAGGFTLASTEIILIFGLQVLYGYVFQMMGLIFMIFMGGLALGAGVGIKIFRIKPSTSYMLLQVGLGLYSILLPFLLLWMGAGNISGIYVQVTLFIFAFLVSWIVGIEYRLAAMLTKCSSWNAVSRNYSADLFGSGMGAFFVTMLLLPYAGILVTGIFLAILNIFSALILLIRRPKSVSLR